MCGKGTLRVYVCVVAAFFLLPFWKENGHVRKGENSQSSSILQVRNITLITIRPELVEEGSGTVLEEEDRAEVAGSYQSL